MVGRSFGSGDTGRRIGAAPVYGYRRVPGLPPVRVARQDHTSPSVRAIPHAHDFLVIGYVEHTPPPAPGEAQSPRPEPVEGSEPAGGSEPGEGSETVDGHREPTSADWIIRLSGRDWALRPGDLYLVAPGEVIDVDHLSALPYGVSVWTAFFPPDAVDSAALRGWRDHPLLAPFVRPGGGVQRIAVPESGQSRLVTLFRELARELRDRRDGFTDAVSARLTLLLVEVLRLAADVPDGLRERDEPLLAEVFDLIERRYAEPISLRDIAAAVAVNPAHLTTVVRRKSGRTVQQWITERRMTEARRLLAETDLTVAAIAARVGYADPGYFTRVFRRDHDRSPRSWRRAALSGASGRVADDEGD